MALGFNNDGGVLYTVPTTGSNKNEDGRTKFEVLCRPIHESIDNEIKQDESILTKWKQCETFSNLPAFINHPVYLDTKKTERHRVMPIAIYMDAVAVPPSRKETFLAIYVYLLCTGTRHLVCLILKSMMCACGCRGYCTLYPIYVFIRWCLHAGKFGIMPEHRHDKLPWRDTDIERARSAGEMLRVILANLDIKGDWADWATNWGFPSWSHTFSPCLFCDCPQSLLRTFPARIGGKLPYKLITNEAYEEAA